MGSGPALEAAIPIPMVPPAQVVTPPAAGPALANSMPLADPQKKRLRLAAAEDSAAPANDADSPAGKRARIGPARTDAGRNPISTARPAAAAAVAAAAASDAMSDVATSHGSTTQATLHHPPGPSVGPGTSAAAAAAAPVPIGDPAEWQFGSGAKQDRQFRTDSMKRLDSMIAALHKSRKVSIDDFPPDRALSTGCGDA